MGRTLIWAIQRQDIHGAVQNEGRRTQRTKTGKGEKRSWGPSDGHGPRHSERDFVILLALKMPHVLCKDLPLWVARKHTRTHTHSGAITYPFALTLN